MPKHPLCPRASYHHPSCHTHRKERLMFSQLHLWKSCPYNPGLIEVQPEALDTLLQSVTLACYSQVVGPPVHLDQFSLNDCSQLLSSIPVESHSQEATPGNSCSSFSTLITRSRQEMEQEPAHRPC